MEAKKERKVNELTLARAIGTMFKNMKSGKIVYLAFSKRSFHILVFVMGMSVIANIALLDLLTRAPAIVQKSDALIFGMQFILSAAAIISGLWLFLKGVNIVTDK